MKTYTGNRATGHADVKIIYGDGEPGPLNPRHDLRNHSPDGFGWGYGGSGPAQLALAILADALTECLALQYYQDFKFAHVASWGESWQITEEEIHEWLNNRQTDEANHP